jgi:alcohol dehydrogenase, propanol-preferring
LELICPVPTGVTPAQAAVTTDAVLTAYHAVKRTGTVKPTDTVVIFGLGGLGFNALQIVLALGSRVIVMDKREEVLAEAVKFGIPKQDVIPVGKDPVEFVQEHNIVVDVVLDFVGVNDTFSASQQLGSSGSNSFSILMANY